MASASLAEKNGEGKLDAVFHGANQDSEWIVTAAQRGNCGNFGRLWRSLATSPFGKTFSSIGSPSKTFPTLLSDCNELD